MLKDVEGEKLKNIPPYILGTVTNAMKEARRKGEDIIDFGMGNPDAPTPRHILDKLIEAVNNPRNHRYSMSRGIYKLRLAFTDWYKRRFDVDIDPDNEAIVTIGAKEAISHLMYGVINQGDSVIVPSPFYAIHAYSAALAGANVISIPVVKSDALFKELIKVFEKSWPKPKILVLNYPHNPTTEVVDVSFFEKVVDFAKENNLMVFHDNAYAELYFDGYKPPSFLQVKGAKDIGVEFYSLSKTYNMAGWRVGFMAGNRDLVGALTRIKSYLDYGMFQPIQIAAIHALNSRDDCVKDIRAMYKSRRDALVDGLVKLGWDVKKPKATMFVWARIPEKFRGLGSVKFAIKMLDEAKTAVSPGAGFGEGGEGFVRFALIENEQRTKQALRSIKKMMNS